MTNDPTDRFNGSVKKVVNYLWLIVGWASFILGFIGIFIPLLPTTPFLILAAFCFDRGSPRLHQWLLNLPFAGKILSDWKTKRVIPLYAKVIATTMILTAIVLMWLKAPDSIIMIKAIVGFIMIFTLGFILKQKSH